MIELFKRFTGALLIAFIRIYQLLISPISGPCCRYYPSCSNYAIEAIRVHGPWRGTLLGIWRLLRCNPWSIGGADPIPKVENKKVEVEHVAG
tara:strand:+ start:791 stop:1066 length:276 start_codon:yes stop_codon:yes gene_type:complete